MTDNGEAELQALLNAMAVLLQKYGLERYQAGFRAGVKVPRPPPIPKEASKPPEHKTPVRSVSWPTEIKRGLR